MRSTASWTVSLTIGRSCSTTTGGGWKTDPAESPDPAQSDHLTELHRWLDSRSRTIRLADLLIEVENDLGFSVHFQQPGERVDPGEVCALLARDPCPRLQATLDVPTNWSSLVEAAEVNRSAVYQTQGFSAVESRGRVGPVWAKKDRRGGPGRLQATTRGRPPRDWTGVDPSGPARRAGGSRSGPSSREWPRGRPLRSPRPLHSGHEPWALKLEERGRHPVRVGERPAGWNGTNAPPGVDRRRGPMSTIQSAARLTAGFVLDDVHRVAVVAQAVEHGGDRCPADGTPRSARPGCR